MHEARVLVGNSRIEGEMPGSRDGLADSESVGPNGRLGRGDHQLPVTGSPRSQFRCPPQFLWLLTLLPALLFAQHDMLWLRTLTGNGSGSDRLQSMTSDPQGNVYVAIRGTLHGYCMVTAKYSPAGDVLWWRRFTHPDEVEPAGIAVDASGNVFVTGTTGEFTSGSNIVIVKYSGSGDSCWSAEYDANGRADVASAINLDRSGDVYVSGTTDLGSVGLDGMLLKYRSNGQFVYMRLNPQTSSRDSICAAVVDSSGYIYQVGYFGTDFVILKYALDGTYQWSQTYWTRGRYLLRACALDPMGNLLACGTSQPHWDTSSFLTAKYDPSGTRLWVREIAKYDDGDWLNFATSIGSDAQGDIYVAGCGPGADSISSGILVVKYAHDGTELWSQLNPALWGDETGAAMCVTPSGEVYVTGCAEAVVKYSTNGESLWVRTWNSMSPTPGTAVTLTPSGGVYVGGWVTGPDDSDILLCYSADGIRLWKKQLNISPGFSMDWANDVVFDPFGNVVVVGRVEMTGNSTDMMTAKYSPDGESLWAQTYHLQEGGYADEALKVETDNTGNVYVLGYSYAESTARNSTILKYAPDGALLWSRSRREAVRDITIDRFGNVILTGCDSAGPTWVDCVTIKYSSLGDECWTRRYCGRGDSTSNGGIASACDSAGAVYVAAFGSVDSLGSSGGLVIKYDGQGNQAWVTDVANAQISLGVGLACIGVDSAGFVHVAGCGRGEWPRRGWLMAAKLCPTGETAWVRAIPFDSSSTPGCTGGLVSRDGRVFLVGVGTGIETTATFAVGPDGSLLWRAPVPGNFPYWNGRMAMDDDAGVLYVTGTPGVSGDVHYRVVGYDSLGRVCWADSFPRDSASILGVACGHDGRIALCGSVSSLDDFYAAVFLPHVGLVESPLDGVSRSVLHLEAFPNPFRDRMSFRIGSSDPNLSLRVFDRTGRLVRSLLGNAHGGQAVNGYWDGTDVQGRPVGAGVYVVVVERASESSARSEPPVRSAVKVIKLE